MTRNDVAFTSSVTGNRFTEPDIWEMLDELYAVRNRLTDWEKHFCTDIGEVFEKAPTLSDKQLEVLEALWTYKTEDRPYRWGRPQPG